MNGRKIDPSFYPVVYGLADDDDWTDEANWYKANPSLGHTIGIDRMRDAFLSAKDNPAEENIFKQLRLDIWTSSTVCWIPDHIYEKGNSSVDLTSLKGRVCYAGLDLSSTSDITAFVMVFPQRTRSTSCSRISGFQKTLWSFVAAVTMCHTMCGHSRALS